MGTPGHEFFTVVEDASGRVVGYLWCEVNREKRRAFLFFVVVEETQRERGVGEAALRQLEGQLKAAGIKSLGLHVFSHNTGALRLYERLGFQVTSVNMQKSL
jgi:ribosomal protein S18 acetylase RimI-like enzyme